MLTPCEFLCVADGCISIWESEMQQRSVEQHVDKSCHIQATHTNLK